MSANQRPRVPSYRLHKASGQAVVTLSGKDHYLGPHGSPESSSKYERLILEYVGNGMRMPTADPQAEYSIGLMCDEFMDHAEGEYRRPDGTLSREVKNIEMALRPLLRFFFDLPASEFGPTKLKLYREQLIEADLCRKLINQRVGIVRRVFRWACSEEKVRPEVFHGLQALQHLKPGRSGARESRPVQPAPRVDVEAALPFMPDPVRAMVQIQLLTGARPGEVIAMKASEINMSKQPWEYRPSSHKNQWRQQDRVIFLGEKSQAAIVPWLRPGAQGQFLFQPTVAEVRRRERMRKARKTPLKPSDKARQVKRKQAGTRAAFRDRYDTTTYAQAIRRACKRAGVEVWTPNRLRHLVATETREKHGIEAASAVLGHRQVETTQIYSANSESKAKKLAE